MQGTNFAPENFGRFFLNCPEKFVGFIPEAMRKYIKNKGNGAKGDKSFWQEKSCAEKFGVFFPNRSGKILVGIPSGDICPPKFI